MRITSEGGRIKSNEVVISRPGVSSSVLFHRPKGAETQVDDMEVVLVKEFRVAASTPDGFMWDLPSGSSSKHGDSLDVAIEECEEEAGVHIARERFMAIGERQLVASMSAHKAAAFKVELTHEEADAIRARPPDACLGVEADTERTFVKLCTVREIKASAGVFVDWSVIGMILVACSNS